MTEKESELLVAIIPFLSATITLENLLRLVTGDLKHIGKAIVLNGVVFANGKVANVSSLQFDKRDLNYYRI